jgi:hypothetical protein
MTGNAILQLEEAAQERLFRLCKQRHIDRPLVAAQHGAQSNQQKLMEIMQRGIACSRIIQTLSARGKLVQGVIMGQIFHAQL